MSVPSDFLRNPRGMLLTQKKSQYAIRALFELSKKTGRGPVKISEIAEIQAIPIRFLEVILHQLKGSGMIDAKRGSYGGYYLVKPPDQITIGEVFRFLQGDFSIIKCDHCEKTKGACPFTGNCAFMPLWQEVRDAVSAIYNRTTLQDLLENEKRVLEGQKPDYCRKRPPAKLS